MDRDKVIKGLERCIEKLDTVVNKALEQFRDMLKQFSEAMDGDEYAQ